MDYRRRLFTYPESYDHSSTDSIFLEAIRSNARSSYKTLPRIRCHLPGRELCPSVHANYGRLAASAGTPYPFPENPSTFLIGRP